MKYSIFYILISSFITTNIWAASECKFSSDPQYFLKDTRIQLKNIQMMNAQYIRNFKLAKKDTKIEINNNCLDMMCEFSIEHVDKQPEYLVSKTKDKSTVLRLRIQNSGILVSHLGKQLSRSQFNSLMQPSPAMLNLAKSLSEIVIGSNIFLWSEILNDNWLAMGLVSYPGSHNKSSLYREVTVQKYLAQTEMQLYAERSGLLGCATPIFHVAQSWMLIKAGMKEFCEPVFDSTKTCVRSEVSLKKYFYFLWYKHIYVFSFMFLVLVAFLFFLLIRLKKRKPVNKIDLS